jgi:hypothetical protein
MYEIKIYSILNLNKKLGGIPMAQVEPSAMLYTQGFGSATNALSVPHYDKRAPGVTDINYPLGKFWLNTLNGNSYQLGYFSVSNGVTSANWTFLGSAAGTLNTLTTDDATVVSPSVGNINIAGASPLSTTGSGSTVTINLSGTVPVASGGTGATTLTGVLTGNGTSAITAHTVTNHGVLLGGASNAVSSLAVAATGTLLAGSTGADPAFTASPSVTGSITAGTTLTATSGAITATNGNLVLGTAGNKISIATGANASAGQSAAMTAGSITISTTAVTASSLIFLTNGLVGGTPGTLSVGTITAGTSFVINSSSGSDTSKVNWIIIN